jgi:hypothetical protein
MHNIKARYIRQRLDRAFNALGKADVTDLDKLWELWAI